MFGKEKNFEIIYDDYRVVRGRTRDAFQRASNRGIQFVIIKYAEGIIVHKAQDWYSFKGVVKPGSWTTRENYDEIKKNLRNLSHILRGLV